MKNQVKVVARTKSGEMLKGFVDGDELPGLKHNKSVYLELINPGNTVGTYINQEQLQGLFIVKSFEGEKPGPMKRFLFDVRKIIKENLPIISAAAVVAVLTLAGFIFLL